MTTAREHYQAGMDALDAASRQPDMPGAAARAAIATAHFTAAQAIVALHSGSSGVAGWTWDGPR